jgi:putative ABC transport system permease protein
MKLLRLSCWLLQGEWRARFVQIIVAVVAIAMGVALGFSIHLINSAALNEFSAANKSLSGQSDMQVYGKHGFFDETVYPKLARYEGVKLANPVLEFTATVSAKLENRNDHQLKILGIDVLRAAGISPDLLGIPAEGRPMDNFADDAIFLSPAAMEWLNLEQGDVLHLNVGLESIALRVAGGLTRARAGQRIAVMDIGAAQWRFQYLGVLSRIELKLEHHTHHEALKEKLTRELGEQFYVSEIADQETRIANMSRAYRINLNMLALVALFTGSFLVFSTQALSIMRRRSQFAFLRVLGYTRRQLLQQILTEGMVLGTIGALLGLVLGYGCAVIAINLLGGNLGSNFFPGIQPSIFINLQDAILFFIIGLSVTVLGAILPAREVVSANQAGALKSGSEDSVMNRTLRSRAALLCLSIGILLTQLPPVYELPIFGYIAIALLLIGGIALMPGLAKLVFTFLQQYVSRYSRNVIILLTVARQANAPNQASIALSGVLASFSLIVAMAVMVLSFRISVDHWLDHVLPADLYVRVADFGIQGGFQLNEQRAISGLPGFVRTDFFRVQNLALNPDRPEITLIARPINASEPDNTLPLIGDVLKLSQLPEGAMPLWVSEAMVDLYGYAVGEKVRIPVGDTWHEFSVAGVWRDYGRQFGALQMQLSDYQALTGDFSINSAALWLDAETTMAEAYTALQQLPFSNVLEITQSQQIRESSLAIFDRSFAITYALEIVAVIIGLSGVAASFSAQMLARAKEFGMLRHIGVTQRQITLMLAAEGCFLTLLGVTLGFILGLGISLILIFIVNPQSFHWTMQLHMPWNWLLLISIVMLVSASLTAWLAGRKALAGSVIRTVREDW